MQNLYVGTASWNIPKQTKNLFPESGSHLERYAQIFNCVEINSSFYRDHKPETYKRWSEGVGKDFKFSVKLSKYFTHQHRFKESGPALRENIQGILELGAKLGVILIQLPPSLAYQRQDVLNFFKSLRNFYNGHVVLEPRHKSWINLEVAKIMADYKINKVLADPEPCPFTAQMRLQTENLRYLRLHGTPEIYKSRYSKEDIQRIADLAANSKQQMWCIFDNTTFGYATENAFELLQN